MSEPLDAVGRVMGKPPEEARKTLIDWYGKDIADDWAWAFMIGCWYIRRFYAVGEATWSAPVDFDLRRAHSTTVRERPGRPRARIIEGPHLAVAPSGIRYLQPKR